MNALYAKVVAKNQFEKTPGTKAQYIYISLRMKTDCEVTQGL